MKILGYGEDALTYWALTTQLGQFLGQLEKKPDPENALLIHRPSFGRGVACFGEFDAIVATQQAVYLVESKWHQSREVKNGGVELKPAQIRRHKAFHWYRSNLTKSYRENWDSFTTEFENVFKSEFGPERCLPPAGSRLQKNLCYVLDKLKDCPPCTTDVLLFISPVGWPQPTPEAVAFRLVCLPFNGVEEGNDYFDMDHTPPKP